MREIKPSFPLLHLLIATAFFGVAAMFAFSPYRNTAMTVASILFCSVGLVMLWFIDHYFLKVKISETTLTCVGYFSVRRFEIKMEQVSGYEIHQKVDQINGLHEEFQIIFRSRGKLVFFGIAYGEYDQVKAFCAERLNFLGYKPLRYGELLGKIIPVMFLISGILAGLVGLLKLIE
jgi:hypothetical protein